MALAQPREAAAHYRTALAIDDEIERSAVLVAHAHQFLGTALAAAGDREEAVEHLRKAAGTFQQEIATSDVPAMLLGSLDRAVHVLGPLLLDMGREPDALASYRMALAATEKYASHRERKETSEKGGRPGPDTEALQGVSKSALYARDFAKALTAAERSLALAPGKRQVEAYRAHALMLLDRADEAKTAYLAHKGQWVDTGTTWEQSVSEGFAELRRAGLTHPMMAEIEKLLGIAEQQ